LNGFGSAYKMQTVVHAAILARGYCRNVA
jgi:hypothetical protein